MPDDGATFKTRTGKDPVQYWLDIVSAVKPTAADAHYALEMQKSRILTRTAAGVDVDGQPFAPYNSTRPVYWHPGAGSKTSTASRDRTFNKLAGVAGKTSFSIDASAFGAKGRAVVTGQYAVKSRNAGIKFSSYAAFKASLGRTVVDLFGPRAPHMLQEIVTLVRSGASGALELVIGIYNDAAVRASAHNFGTKNLPRRHFFGANTNDIKLMGQDLKDRMIAKVRQKL